MAQDAPRRTRITLSRVPLVFLCVLILLTGIQLLISFSGIMMKTFFEPAPRLIINPLMGWAPWATAEDIHQPHTLIYADLTWREFEPHEGQYDFAAFEEKNRLAFWRDQGKRVVFRFVLDVPRDEAHMDIPDWLYEATRANGDHYDVVYGKGYSPDYSGPILIKAHQKAIQALGERYGKDDFFAFIQLGSLGHWGEWHVKSDSNIRPVPGQDIRDVYVSHYLNAFPDTHLLMRRPFTIANELHLGLYNDMTGDPDATERWLAWIAEGGEYSQTGELSALAAMPAGWHLAPIGGEQTGSLSDEVLYRDDLDRTLDLLRKSHTTFIGPGGPYDLPPENSLQAGLDKVLSTIGYRFYVSELNMQRQVVAGMRISGKAAIANDGIAPFYYPWAVWFYIMDERGEVRLSRSAGESLIGVLPDHSKVFGFSLPLETLEVGQYTLGIGIVDPMTGKPAIFMGMANSREDDIQVLGSFEIVSWRDMLAGLFNRE